MQCDAIKHEPTRAGPKGRFCEPRAKPWDCAAVAVTALNGPLVVRPYEPAFQAGNQPIILFPGLRPGLTEPALQAGLTHRDPVSIA